MFLCGLENNILEENLYKIAQLNVDVYKILCKHMWILYIKWFSVAMIISVFLVFDSVEQYSSSSVHHRGAALSRLSQPYPSALPEALTYQQALVGWMDGWDGRVSAAHPGQDLYLQYIQVECECVSDGVTISPRRFRWDDLR